MVGTCRRGAAAGVRQQVRELEPALDVARIEFQRPTEAVLGRLGKATARESSAQLLPRVGRATTLIHTLLGFHPPSAGTAHIFGYDIAHEAKQIKSLIGYMPERDSFIAKMSAVHFVRLMGELSGLPPEAALERAHEALFYVGLGEARYRRLRLIHSA